MIFNEEDRINYNNATHCHICDEPLGCKETTVRDHCHISGKFRGAAHSICNAGLHYRYIKIPIFFHNLKGYDSHFIISAINSEFEGRIEVIAQNSQKFINFGFHHLSFKDSLGFLNSSLEKLVKMNKYKGNDLNENWIENFKHSREFNPYVKNERDLFLLTEKGGYPYDFLNDIKQFKENKLPPKEAFYSKLTDSEISGEDYERAKTIWKHFNIKKHG